MDLNRIRQLLDYDPETGVFTWRVNRSQARTGEVAGCNFDGYVAIRIDGTRYLAHRLAWLFTYGKFPVGDTDHINRIKCDNRICNLREATRSQNKMNAPARRDSSTHLRGITPRPKHRNFQVRIQINGKRTHIGCFDSAEEAALAYENAAKLHYGEFGYHREAA